MVLRYVSLALYSGSFYTYSTKSQPFAPIDQCRKEERRVHRGSEQNNINCLNDTTVNFEIYRSNAAIWKVNKVITLVNSLQQTYVSEIWTPNIGKRKREVLNYLFIASYSWKHQRLIIVSHANNNTRTRTHTQLISKISNRKRIWLFLLHFTVWWHIAQHRPSRAHTGSRRTGSQGIQMIRGNHTLRTDVRVVTSRVLFVGRIQIRRVQS